MSTTTFNALTATRDLEAAGFERKQAEALTETLHRAATAERDELATKADLAELRAELRADLATLKADLYRAFRMQGGAIAALILAPRLF